MKSPSPPTPPSRSPRRWSSCIAAAAMIGFASTMASAAPSTTVVISQVYGGGGNSGALYTNDFIELHNISSAPVDLTGWSVQYASAAGTTWTVTSLSGTIPAGSYFLIQQAQGSGGTQALPTPDATGTIAMAASNGKIALSNTTTAFSGASPIGNPALVDFVGFGTANAFEGSGAITGLGNNASATRLDSGSQDTDDNAADFVTLSPPAPRNSASPPYTPGGDSTPPEIITYSPENGATDVPVVTNQLVATFSENIVKGTGSITLKLVADDTPAMSSIDVTSPAVVVSGATATITLPASLAGSTSYYVNIDAGAFKDFATNNFAGISDKVTWAFTTATPDLTPPAPTLFPLDDSSDFVATASPTLTYDEPVALGAGIIELRASAGGALIESFDVATSPRVTLSGTTLRINPADPLAVATGYYLVVPQGVVEDLVGNPSDALSGPDGWNFTTRGIPAVLISQYYEGTSQNRYLELRNTTGSPVSLDGYQIAAFSPSDLLVGNQGWKTGQSSPRVTDLSTLSIPANGYFLIAEPAASIPLYAIPDLSPTFPSAVGFSGTASIVLYKNTGFAIEDVVDAISVTLEEGTDISFYRQNDLPGFDFDIDTSILQFTGASQPWDTKTIAEVDAAGLTDPWLLQGTVELEGALTLEISPAILLESGAPATATVTRSGNTSLEVFVTISNSNPHAAYATTIDSAPDPAVFVSIPANQSSAVFDIVPFDTPWLTGDRTTTITVSSASYTSDSKEVTVQDDAEDVPFPVVINELDADTPGTDVDEFVELHNQSNEAVSLDGVVLVLYNGFNDLSYGAIDLSGQTIPANGFFVIGSPTVPNVNLAAFDTNSIQNGADAVALYLGKIESYPTDTPVTTPAGVLVDALVHDTNDPDDLELLAALMPEGASQINESANGASGIESISRVPDGGAAFDTSVYVVQTPTPGATNVLPPAGVTFADWIAGFDVGLLTGFNDDFDNDGLANALENILGSDPSVSNQGLTAVSTSAGSLVFRHTLAADADIAVDLTFEYEWSVDLANWQASGASAGETIVTFANPVVITPGVGGAPDLVEVTATVTGTPASKVFARLRVDQEVAP